MAINPQAVRGPVTAVPVVAGKGVRLVADTENNRVVAEADETVLWDGNGTALSTATLDESIYNFERLAIYLYMGGNSIHRYEICMDLSPATLSVGGVVTTEGSVYFTYVFACKCSVTNSGKTLTVPQKGNGFEVNTSGVITYYQNNNIGTIRKIVGINRVASA